MTRIAVDGRLLAVRQVLRWQGPIDVGDLVAIGYAPAVSLRMSGRWRFVQRSAGPPLRRSAHQGFEPELAEQLAQRDDLRVVTVYCGRGYLSPGFQRHLAPYVRQSSALVSATVEQVFAHVEAQTSEPNRPHLTVRLRRTEVRSRGRRPESVRRSARYGPYSGCIRSPVARKPGALGTAGLSGGGP